MSIGQSNKVVLAELSSLGSLDEGVPFLMGEEEGRLAGVLAVAYCYATGFFGDLNALLPALCPG